MQTWAHVVDGTVENIIELDDDIVPGKDMFSPDYAKDMRKAPPGTAIGAKFDGTSYAAPPPPAVVVPTVDAVYALIQLSRTKTKDGASDLLTETRQAVAKVGAEAQLWFDRAQRWARKDPYVEQIAAALKLNDADVDELFIAASKIPSEKSAS